MFHSRFSALRAGFAAPTVLASTAVLLALAAGASQAQTVDFTGINLAAVSSAAGETFLAGSGGTVNVRLISGDVDNVVTGSSPDPTGFYALRSDTSQSATFRFTLSLPQSFTITNNESVTQLETDSFSMPTGTWSVLRSSNATVTNSGPNVSIQGLNNSGPFGDYQVASSGPSFNFTITDNPGFSQYGSAISLKLNGVTASAAAPEPGSIALLATSLLPLGGLIARRCRSANIPASSLE